VLKVAGRVISVDLAKDRDGKSKGYAVVQFSEPTEAVNAIGTYYHPVLLIYM
jgi:RNA recognition motif-containing protein